MTQSGKMAILYHSGDDPEPWHRAFQDCAPEIEMRVYPDLSHINKLREYPRAEFSVAAFKADKKGKRVLIEHVSPRRDFTRKAIAKLDEGASDENFLKFVQEHYQLVLLTPEETTRLNRINRTEMTCDRLEQAGIKIKPA